MKRFIGAVLTLVAIIDVAHAKAEEWHWERFGNSSYQGQVQLRDDLGISSNYQRFSGGNTAPLFGSTSVQSPLMVVEAAIKMDIVRGGTAVTKPNCPSTKAPAIYVAPVTVCNYNEGSAMSAFNAYADNTSSTTWTPHVAAYFQGYGWHVLDNTDCGRIQVTTMCQ